MKKHNDLPSVTTNSSASPEPSASKHGLIATIRESPHVPPDEVPESPDGVEPISLEQQWSDVPCARRPLAGAHRRSDGDRAQSGEPDRALRGLGARHHRSAGARARRIADHGHHLKAQDLHVASATQLKVARSDAHGMVKSVAAAVRFAGTHNPKVLKRWAAVLRYDSAHGQSVADGREKAKRAREAAKKAEAKKASAKPEGDKPASDKPSEG
ncbi:MAG: hypothetical protein R3A52_24355 [Polyangiales bacterium]